MPDAAGRIKGISLSGISNTWLDSLERKPYQPITVPAAFVDYIASEAGVPRVVLMNDYIGRKGFHA